MKDNQINPNSILHHEFPPDISNIYDEQLANQLAATQGAISGLNQAVPLLLNPDLLRQPILDKEAESSSKLEGTQVSAEDVYKSVLIKGLENNDDVKETKNYKKALEYGMSLIDEGVAIKGFFIRSIHKILLEGVRGQTKNPGEYRDIEVWIGSQGTSKGEARYIPPEPAYVKPLMDDLELYISSDRHNPLISCAIIHHRLEAIHPFKDGNGRTGRLLITLFLIEKNMLDAPILYPSGFFEKNKDDYTSALHSVDKGENWRSWIMLFLKGLQEQAEVSLKIARDIDDLFKEQREKIQNNSSHIKLMMVLEFCFKQPYVTASLVSKSLNIPHQTASRYVKTLESESIIVKNEDLSKGNSIVYENAQLLTILRNI